MKMILCRKFLNFLVVCLALLSLSACVKIPTQATHTVDDRPTLSFKLQAPKSASDYRIFVDGVDQGSLDQYVGKYSGLRLLSGTHQLRIEKNDEVVLKRQVYLGDGSAKELVVP